MSNSFNYPTSGIVAVVEVNTAPVQSVNGKTGHVVLTETDIQLGYEYVSDANKILQPNKNYILSTVNNSIVAVLPNSPQPGQGIGLTIDLVAGRSVTINRNNSKINSIDDDLFCDLSVSFKMIFINNTIGWKIFT